MEKNIIYNEDCLIGMKIIPDASIDCIICDLPYGVLNKNNRLASWDKIIPLNILWKEYERIIKQNGAIILFSQGIFTAKLMLSNEKLYRYDMVWKKGLCTSGFLNARRMPLRNHESILVFYKKLPVYNPQMTLEETLHERSKPRNKNSCYGYFKDVTTSKSNERYPLSVVDIAREYLVKHPTQKPVRLIEYLIKTYTNEGELVLDNCIGSGTTAVACINTNRDFIGFELDKKFFDISIERINSCYASKTKTNHERTK